MDDIWYQQLELGFLRKCAEDGCSVEEAIERSRWLGSQDPEQLAKTASVMEGVKTLATVPILLAAGGLALAYPAGRYLGYTAAKNLYPNVSIEELQKAEKLRQLEASNARLQNLSMALDQAEQRQNSTRRNTQTHNFNIY